MDNCVIHSNSIIAAGAVVLENTIVESGSIYAGIPAKKVKDLNEEQTEALLRELQIIMSYMLAGLKNKRLNFKRKFSYNLCDPSIYPFIGLLELVVLINSQT